MSEPPSFKAELRRGKIAPPTSKTFAADEWRQALQSDAHAAEADFLQAGLWFNDRLQQCWRDLHVLDLGAAPKTVLMRHIAAVANRMHVSAEAALGQAATELLGDDLQYVGVLNAKLGDNADHAATADMIRTSSIDTLGKFAAYVHGLTRSQGGARLDDRLLRAAFAIFEDIYLLEYIWARIAWSDWRTSFESDRLVFSTPDRDPWGVAICVAEYRREHLLAEFAFLYSQEWAAQSSVLPPMWQVRIRKKADRLCFDATRLAPDRGSLSLAYLLREALKVTELGPYLDTPLPSLGEPAVSLSELLEGWELLSLAAEGLGDAMRKRGLDAAPLSFAPTVRIRDLDALLQRLSWPADKRRAVLRFLIFEADALDGLWSKPFLPLVGERVTPVLTPLICPNLYRTAELWVSAGAGDVFFTRRGNEAEARLRSALATALQGRPWQSTARVLQTSWEPKIEGVRRDIDLVIRIGANVFIGELKLKKYPVSAAEVGRHRSEFIRAAEQLDIRLAWLAKNKDLIAAKTDFDGAPDALTVHGFIVSGTAFGSGLAADGYPIIDRDALEFYFDNDEFLVAATASRDHGYRGKALRPSLALPLVKEDPAASFLAYLRWPLHVRHPEHGLTIGVRTNRLKLSGHTLEWPEPHLDGEQLLPEHAESIAAAMSNAWRAQQDAAAASIEADGAAALN